MNTDTSLFSFILHASMVVKIVLLILVAASIISWSIILYRTQVIRSYQKNMRQFESEFYAGTPMDVMFDRIKHFKQHHGLGQLFEQSMREYNQFTAEEKLSPLAIAQYRRVMDLSIAREIDELQNNVPFLATIGSTTPYIGLFGTVWGIMTAFQGLGTASQVTIAMVAPGISEALIATAMGLFAAIPAVIAYNHFANRLNQIEQQLENFSDEMIATFTRNTRAAFADQNDGNHYAAESDPVGAQS